MKCFTNENNPATLRILIAANSVPVYVSLEIVNAKEWKASSVRRLPTLVLSDSTKFFSCNCAARYIWKPEEQFIDEIDKWLEWDSSILQPALYGLNLEKPTDSNVISLLDKVEQALNSNKFLIGNKSSLADIVVWSSLFGIITHENFVTKHLSDKKILSWFEEIKKLDTVMSALKTWNGKSGADVLTAFKEAVWFANVNDSVEVTNTRAEVGNVQSEVSVEDIKKAENAWLNGTLSRPKPEIQTVPVLPLPGKKNILITSALPYVNNVPHLGNIIGCVLSADVFARYCRLRNWNTLYICGTDEYGTATETKALEEKLTPQQICDKYFKIHKETYSWFNIDFNHFGRTTTTNQKEITQELFWDVYKNNFTSVESMEQLLCESCDRFLADRFVEGICPKCKFEDARGDQCDGCGQLINAVELIKPRCKVCGKMPVIKNSDQLFLELPKIEPVLREWIQTSCDGWTHNARSITHTWLKDGLKPRCITRDLKWGTPVPLQGFENKVFYVWFDAPIGYLSITACYTKEWRKWWQPSKEIPVSYYQFMAKDNVPFHSVMFPATLLAIDKKYLLVDSIMATEYLNYEDGKFSKSRGIGVFGTDAKDTGLPADVFRFYLLYVRPESQDSSFSWDDLAMKHNSELLNNIGNFVNRALMFTEKFFDGTIPKMVLNEEDFALLALITKELEAYNSAIEKGKLKDGIKYMLNISRHGNQYMQNMKPWVSVKGSDNEKLRAGTVVGLSCNIAALLAITIQPYMPSISDTMREQMNASRNLLVLTNEVNILLPEEHKIGKPAPLFSKIEQSTVDELKKKFSGRQKSVPDSKSSIASQADYKSIVSVEKMEVAVAKQGDMVRQLKASGAEKSLWMPHVDVLKNMKKHLDDLKKMPAISKTSDVGAQTVDKLEMAVTEQGNKVRQMKSSGVDKSVWMQEVEILKGLKKQLEDLKLSDTPTEEAANVSSNNLQNTTPGKGKNKGRKNKGGS